MSRVTITGGVAQVGCRKGSGSGLTLSIDGGIGTVLNAPGPTGPTVTPFVITAPSTGLFNFTLNYAECCGAPAILQWTFPSGTPIGSGVPEPGCFALIGVALPGMIWLVRRRAGAR